MTAGSESRTTDTLYPLLSSHEYWNKIEPIISSGVTYHLEDITGKERIEDVDHMIARGNYKSAQLPENAPTLHTNYEKEVTFG